MERLRTLKRRITVATILGFAVFSWLAAPRGTGHATGPAAPPAASGGGGAAQVDPNGSQSQDGQSQGGFFDPAVGGSRRFLQGGGGYGLGNAQGGPVAGSGAS